MSLPLSRPSGPLLHLRQVEESLRQSGSEEERQREEPEDDCPGGSHLESHSVLIKWARQELLPCLKDGETRLPERKSDSPLVAQLVNGRIRTGIQFSRPRTWSPRAGQAQSEMARHLAKFNLRRSCRKGPRTSLRAQTKTQPLKGLKL